jgi:TonB family protein
VSVNLTTIILSLIVSAVLGSFGQAQAVGQRRSTAKTSRTQLAAVESRCFRGNLNALAVRMPILSYPREARRRGIGGIVTIKIFVNEKGAVYYASVVEGHRLLRQTALRAARAAHFAPFMQDDRPVKCAGQLVYTFNPPEPQAAHAQKKQRVYSADDPHGLKVLGMPKARHKYLITDLPAGTEVPAEYRSCGNGVYYLKERVRGVDLTAVVVHFRAEGDFELTADMFEDAKLLRHRPRIGSYIPQNWVSFTFTFLPDAFTLQAIRVMREFPERSIFGTDLQRSSAMVEGGLVRLDRSWVDKDPYVTWEILPESQLSHLIFRIRLPKSTKECLQGKK